MYVYHHKKEGRMNHSYKYLIRLILVSTIMVILIPINLFPRICANGSGGAFGGEESISHGMSGVSSLIETHVIEGAGHFLNAYSNILLFLNRVEKSGLEEMDFKEAALIVNRAIENMDNALAVYNQLIDIAERTPYNKNTIAKLMDFDYNGFMSRCGLNNIIFKEVKMYLSNGDVIGMYKYIRNEFLLIRKSLRKVKNDIDTENIPIISSLWTINDEFSKTLNFGQIVSRCFYEINSK